VESQIFDAYTKIRTSEVRVSAPNGQVRKLPESLHAFLAQLSEDLETGKPVTIFEVNADLTTAEAARTLAVSRQFLVNLLEEGVIPFHMVGTHRRVYARDVLSFKTKRDQMRRKTLDDLVRAELHEGLYDRVPLNESRTR
jgi:excisionase family DNA binding protein